MKDFGVIICVFLGFYVSTLISGKFINLSDHLKLVEFKIRQPQFRYILGIAD